MFKSLMIEFFFDFLNLDGLIMGLLDESLYDTITGGLRRIIVFKNSESNFYVLYVFLLKEYR